MLKNYTLKLQHHLILFELLDNLVIMIAFDNLHVKKKSNLQVPYEFQ